MAMRQCPNCKNPVKPNAKFCAKCGRALGAATPPKDLSGFGNLTGLGRAPFAPVGSHCPHCGKPNRVGAKFCAHCRQPLAAPLQAVAPPRAEIRCPKCGATNRAGARFCAKCRSDLPAGERAPIVPPLRGGVEMERGRFPWIVAALGSVAAVMLCVALSIGAWFATDGGKKIAGVGASATPTASASSLSVSSPTPTAETVETPAATAQVTPSIPAVTATAVAVETPITATPVTPSIPAVTPTAAACQMFEGTGYTLLYPTGWYVYQSPPGAVDRSGARYDLILSDAPGNRSPQSATPDESARVTVYYLPKAKQPLEEWVSERWAWLDVPLTAATLDDAPALGAAALSTDATLFQEFVWIEHRGQYYTVKAYARADALDALDKIKKVMDSFLLKK
jgi:hypothetical protein